MAKKLLALLLVFVFAFSLAACGEDATDDGAKTNNTSSTAQEESSEVETADASSEPDATSSEEKTTESSEDTKTGSSETESPSSTTATTGTPTRGPINRGSGTTNTSSTGGAVGGKNQSEKKNITSAYKDIKIKEGDSLVDKLDFKGKTFTMAITEEGQYNTASFKRCIAAFEQQYNCKIATKTLDFGKYNQQVSQAKAAGKPYDICYAHGSMFPACAIDGLYNDLSDSLRQADLMDDNDPTAGGIDLPKTSYFVYNKKIYGTCNFSSCFPYVIYYNKVAMAEAGYTGSSDPRKLDENGKWNWDNIIKIGRKLTDVNADKYFLSNSFSGRGINLAHGAPIVTVNNGVYKQNITSDGYMAGLKMMQTLFVGNGRIAEPRDSSHPYNTYESMLRGSAYMFTEETSKYLDMAKDVKTSSHFNRNKDNIGITSMPLGETNKTKAYPTGWLTAVCSGAGKGSNELVAIAWDVFRSRYVDPVTDSNAMNSTDKKFTDDLLKGDICCEVGKFATSDTDTLKLTESTVIPNVVKGSDISQQVTAVKDQMTACINSTLK